LADEVCGYDLTRGLENQDVADNMQHLRHELQDLADYVRRLLPAMPAMLLPIHRTPSVRAASVAPEMPPRIQLINRPPAGDGVILSPISPRFVEVVVPAPA
jgi:hypothetical protein